MLSRSRSGALAGATGGLAMVLAGLVLQPLIGLPTVPTLLQDRLVKLTPGPLFGLLIDRLQYAGRPLLYSGLLLVELVALTIAGVLVAGLAAHRDGANRHRLDTLLGPIAGLAILVWLALGLVVMPLAGLGPFALTSRFASSVLLWGYFLEALLYSAVTWLVLAGLADQTGLDQPGHGADPRRRGVAASVAVAALATLGGTALVRYRGEQVAASTTQLAPGVPVAPTATAARTSPATARSEATSTGVPAPPSAILNAASLSTNSQATVAATTPARTTTTRSTPLVTPNTAFYVVSKNLDDPVVKADGWHLSVKGLVQTPVTLNYQALTALPSVEQYRTLACISNDVGGSLMSNALWRGVPLATLLDKAGADPGAAYVLFSSVDGYTESVPVAVARQPTTVIAYQMNSAPLPPAHGFPARIVLAGRYGMKNPKWLTTITVAQDDKPGFWEQQGWDEQAIVRTTSRIDGPRDGATLAASALAISGVAYAGDRGIRSVQVQVTPGTPWTTAMLQPVDAVSTWAAWRYTWTPPKPGSYHITVRATDGTGALQEASAQDSYPLGATGLHAITVQVR